MYQFQKDRTSRPTAVPTSGQAVPVTAPGESMPHGTMPDWSREISMPPAAARNGGSVRGTSQLSGGQLDMHNRLPAEVVESPTTVSEAYKGSLNAMLSQNIGTYIVATFLVGTQSTVSWEGILYEVGNNYVTIYQEGRDRYIVADIYSLKFMEFYDVERRKLCEAILQEQGWQGSSLES